VKKHCGAYRCWRSVALRDQGERYAETAVIATQQREAAEHEAAEAGIEPRHDLAADAGVDFPTRHCPLNGLAYIPI